VDVESDVKRFDDDDDDDDDNDDKMTIFGP